MCRQPILDIMEHMNVQIESLTPDDWLEVCAIYEEGIATGLGTFETKAPSWDEWNAARLTHSRLVARDGQVLGWAALSPVSSERVTRVWRKSESTLQLRRGGAESAEPCY